MAHYLEVPKKEEKKSITEVEKEIELEEKNVEVEQNSTKCVGCARKGFTESVAIYICFICEMYVCISCSKDHELHEVMHIESERMETESEGLGKKSKRVKLEESSDSKIMREKRERTKKSMKRRMAEKLWEDVKNENNIDREERFQNRNISVYDRVQVKHVLDSKNCYISGLCGIGNMGWIVCDCYNNCMKMFELGSNVLRRYIRLTGYRPWDITKIWIKQSSAQSHSTSSDISVTDLNESIKQCLVAITSQHERKILYLDLGKTPALVCKVITTEKESYGISFYDHKIFTVCRDDYVSVYIKSVDGETLNILYTNISFNFLSSSIAVISGRLFLTDYGSDKVQCRNFQDEVISETTIVFPAPKGICADSDLNVYICSSRQRNVYKLDSHLTEPRPVVNQNTDYLDRPFNLCHWNDKLFISHVGPFRNFVTVVGLL